MSIWMSDGQMSHGSRITFKHENILPKNAWHTLAIGRHANDTICNLYLDSKLEKQEINSGGIGSYTNNDTQIYITGKFGTLLYFADMHTSGEIKEIKV